LSRHSLNNLLRVKFEILRENFGVELGVIPLKPTQEVIFQTERPVLPRPTSNSCNFAKLLFLELACEIDLRHLFC
jgi:hypothetical protein